MNTTMTGNGVPQFNLTYRVIDTGSEEVLAQIATKWHIVEAAHRFQKLGYDVEIQKLNKTTGIYEKFADGHADLKKRHGEKTATVDHSLADKLNEASAILKDASSSARKGKLSDNDKYNLAVYIDTLSNLVMGQDKMAQEQDEEQ